MNKQSNHDKQVRSLSADELDMVSGGYGDNTQYPPSNGGGQGDTRWTRTPPQPFNPGTDR